MVDVADKRKKIPYFISMMRILLVPIFIYAYIWFSLNIAIIVYIGALLSDIVDGRLAKKLGTKSTNILEAYIDPVADFVLVLGAFFAFSVVEIYPPWILGVFILIFAFFLTLFRIALKLSVLPTFS